ncbi:C39 family peptidase [Chloroflexota bacterium]
MNKRILKFLIGLLLIIIISVAVYWIPPVHSRLSWRLENITTRIKYAFNPPEESIFLPSPITQTAFPELTTETPTIITTSSTATVSPDVFSITPTISPTPLPDFVTLPNVVYVDQHNRWNYCGPSNLTMALNYWGWKGTRDDVAAIVKPGIQDMSLDFIQQGRSDKNVMPYEMTDYVQDYTDYNVVLRYGGDIDLIKKLVAAGFPVVAEKGYYEEDYTGKIGWLGHYQFVTGYENGIQSLIVQDTYNDGPNFRIPYEKFTDGWRSFNFVFFIVYPPQRDFEVFRLLGQWADPNWGYQHALDLAEADIQNLTGIDLFFAWFNKGTSLVKLGRYADAAKAYDQAFLLNSELGTDKQQRPYRMMWYQTGPYMAYYYSGRYGDVINLADITLETISPPTLEESFYWRGMAEIAIGQSQAGIDDLRESVRLNPYFTAGISALANLGLQP